jgi:nucleotide-binding universal stress UspA family protein
LDLLNRPCKDLSANPCRENRRAKLAGKRLLHALHALMTSLAFRLWAGHTPQACPPPMAFSARLTKEDPMKTVKKILCSLDLSEHSALVAEYAVAMAKAFNAEITAVYVAPALTQYVGFHVPPSSIESFVGEIVSGAEKNMEDFVAEHFQGVRATGKVVNGYASEEILNLAERGGADIIIMGTHGRKGIDRILFGSVAEKVVKNSVVPVMTVRPKS